MTQPKAGMGANDDEQAGLQGGIEDDETDPADDGQTIDHATGLPEGGGGRIKLSTLRDIRLEMARVYRSVKRGKLEESAATKRVYILGEIGKIITVAELEKRINELEAQRALNGQRTPLLPQHQH